MKRKDTRWSPNGAMRIAASTFATMKAVGRRMIHRPLEREIARRTEEAVEGVAHDLNNILGVIQSLSHLLLVEHDLPASARADVIEIQQAASRAAELTRKLRALGRKQPIQPSALELDSDDPAARRQ